MPIPPAPSTAPVVAQAGNNAAAAPVEVPVGQSAEAVNPIPADGTMMLPLEAIRLDGGTQPRASIDYDTMADYADAMIAGTVFPPVLVFYDGTSYWLADGFHRVDAAKHTPVAEIACEVRQGTQQDAQWYSFSANKTNGLRRTNEDKQRAVKAALAHPKAASLSNRQIADHVGVDEGTVRNWREKLTAEVPQSVHRTGRDGRTINTARIGKRANQGSAGGRRSIAAPVSAPADPPTKVTVRIAMPVEEPSAEPPRVVVRFKENSEEQPNLVVAQVQVPPEEAQMPVALPVVEKIAEPLRVPLSRYHGQPPASVSGAVDRALRAVERVLRDYCYPSETEFGDALLFHIIKGVQALRRPVCKP